jgi:putative membrane protein
VILRAWNLLDAQRRRRCKPQRDAAVTNIEEHAMDARLRKTALAAALLSMGLAMGANAQTSQPANGGTSANMPRSSATTGTTPTTRPTARNDNAAQNEKLARGDRKFIEEAAQGGMAEVQLGQLAAQKAQSDQVKQFGQKMVDEHGKANDQLKQLASSKGLNLPTELDGKHKREMERLSKLSGADFDREYMKHMVSDHKKDVKDFKKEAKSAKDADLKSFASSTTPTLEQHLQLAESTYAAVRNEGKSNTARTSSTQNVAPGTTSASNLPGNSGAYGASGSPSAAPPSSTAASKSKPGT